MTVANVMIWNIRVLNGLNKQHELRVMCLENKLRVIALAETKLTAKALDACHKQWLSNWGSIHNSSYNKRLSSTLHLWM